MQNKYATKLRIKILNWIIRELDRRGLDETTVLDFILNYGSN